jgi:diguanylate cyclase (GGDEF)-like protein
LKLYGRIFFVSIAVVSALRWMFYYYQETGRFNWNEIIHNIPVFIIVWFLGKKYDEAKFLSNFDPLTKTNNRRFIFKEFNKLVKRADKNNNSLTLFLIDIDRFKQINDNNGHNVGDDALIHISDILKDNRKKEDIVCRWGGDEFVIITSNANDEQGIQLIEQWKCSLDKLSQRLGIPVSASIGMSSYPHNGVELDQLVKYADHKMYADKNNSDDYIKEEEKVIPDLLYS